MSKTNERIKEQMARYHSADPIVRERATEEIIDDYRRFITHLINKHFSTYMSKYYEDMFSVGVIGLLDALTKYDPEKSMPTTFFATYIVHDIYEFVASFVGNTTPHYASKITKLNKARSEFESEGKDNPTVIDLSMRTGIKPEIVLKCQEIQMAAQTQSYDCEEFVFSNMTTDSHLQPEEILIRAEGQAVIQKAILDLPDDMREVVMRKLGLENHTPQTNEQISAATGIKTRQVRFLYSRALERMRESEVFAFFASQYRTAPRVAKESVALIPEDTAARMITALLEYDENYDDVENA